MEVLTGSGSVGFTDGGGATVQFNNPFGVTVDDEGNAIVSDFRNNRMNE